MTESKNLSIQTLITEYEGTDGVSFYQVGKGVGSCCQGPEFKTSFHEVSACFHNYLKKNLKNWLWI